MGKKAVDNFKKQLEESQCNGQCQNINFKVLVKEGKPADTILKTIDERRYRSSNNRQIWKTWS